MKRKAGLALLVLALFVCMIPAMQKDAKAGQYDYYLTFDTQGGHLDSWSGPSTKKFTLAQSYYSAGSEAAKHTAYKEGYDFLGWYTAASGGTKVTKNYYGAPSKVYAHWQKKTYTVSYNANGGSGAPSAQTKTYGVNLTLRTGKPTRTGYIFQGWATSANGGVVYSAGGTYKNNSGVTLYAVWKKQTFTITIYSNPGGQNGNVYTMTKEYGVNVTIPPTSAPAGLYLAGYGIPGATTTVKYHAGDTYSENANLTLYPIYVDITTIYNSINNQFEDGKDENVVVARERKECNMACSALFQNGTTCCTDSALKDLLNRRLARAGKFAKNYYFDIRDVLEGNATDGHSCAGDSVTLIESGLSQLIFSIPWKNEKIIDPYTYGGHTNETIKFSNFWGRTNIDMDMTTYTVISEYGQGGNSAHEKAENNKNRIIELLQLHPEGVFIYTSHKKSASTNERSPHALVVVGYVDGHLMYIDNGSYGTNSHLPCEFGSINNSDFYDVPDGQNGEEGLLSSISVIAYIKQ